MGLNFYKKSEINKSDTHSTIQEACPGTPLVVLSVILKQCCKACRCSAICGYCFL